MNEHSPYPIAYGNEEEMSFRTRGGNAIAREELLKALEIYNSRRKFNHGVIVFDQMDTTGGRDYVDGSQLERASPEYRSPKELADRVQANEQFGIDIAGILIQYGSVRRNIGVNRRNLDSYGNHFASHDNLAIRWSRTSDELESRTSGMLVAHALTRGIIVGAGYSGTDGMYFAQKATSLGKDKINKRGYISSIYCIRENEAGAARVELRSSDTNISWDSTWRRLGLNAIALSVAQTRLRKRFETFIEGCSNVGASALTLSRMPLNEYGEFTGDKGIKAADSAASFQMNLLEAFMSERMKGYGDQPPELMTIAEDAYAFGEQLRKVLRREGTIESLAVRGSDWAAKLMVISRRLRRDRSEGVVREYGDLAYRKDDLGYDYIEVAPTGLFNPEKPESFDAKEVKVTKRGYGYRLRDEKRLFPTCVDPETVAQAALNPPEDTRAAARAHLIKNFKLYGCGWNFVVLEGRNRRDPKIKIDLKDLLSTELPSYIDGVSRRSPSSKPKQRRKGS
jgi:hypothetical protein